VLADFNIRVGDDDALDIPGSVDCAGLLESIYMVGGLRRGGVGVLSDGGLVTEVVVAVRIQQDPCSAWGWPRLRILRHIQILRRLRPC
jgi:hypothetical protein